MSESNLRKVLGQADVIDYDEGQLAYERYNMLMQRIAIRYAQPLDRVVAAFCALSPNNDYQGNLRSLISVLEGVDQQRPWSTIQISTYRHCGQRAYNYLKGLADFELEVKGPKILNFYYNILQPRDVRWVTIDGHMVGAWRDNLKLTMKQAIPSASEYREIKAAVQRIAFDRFLVPNHVQAIIWFTRKRLARSVYSPQLSLFAERGDIWDTLKDLERIKPFPWRKKDDI